MHNIPKQSTLIVGFSGGPDSVYLIEHLTQNTDYHVIAAHLDHEWRSDFTRCCGVKTTAIKKTFRFLKVSGSYACSSNRISKEMLVYGRYFLESCAQKYSHSFIALGHHLMIRLRHFYSTSTRNNTVDWLHERARWHLHSPSFIKTQTRNCGLFRKK